MVERGGPANRWKPALLSGLVFPGLGQLANRKPWRALAFFGATLALLAAFLVRIWNEVQARMPQDPELLLDPGFPLRLADEVQRSNAALLFWITCGLLAVWAGSVIDAWLCARDRNARNAPSA